MPPLPGPHGPIPDPTPGNDVVPYQERIEYLVDHRAPRKTAAVIADPPVVSTPPVISGAYVQAEVAALRTAILELTALRASVLELRNALRESGVTA